MAVVSLSCGQAGPGCQLAWTFAGDGNVPADYRYLQITCAHKLYTKHLLKFDLGNQGNDEEAQRYIENTQNTRNFGKRDE